MAKRPDFFAEKFYENVFEASPRLKHTFRNTDLKLQKVELIKGLLSLHTLLENKADLDDFLYSLEVRHLCYEVIPEDYEVIAYISIQMKAGVLKSISQAS